MGQKARDILEAQKHLREAFKKSQDIIVISDTPSNIFGFTSKTINCITLCGLMKKEKHWCLMNAQRPPSAHLSVTHETINTWKDFVESLRHCVKMMKKDQSLNQNEDTALYGMTG